MPASLHGVLILNKPSDWTSHDVVAKVRGLLKERQIGHLGTLDPLATGVLPLAVGAATRLIEFTDYSKEYVATCLLGKSTDSCDITGKVVGEKPVKGLSEQEVRRETLALKELTEQVPPMVSALKKDGQKLYQLARKGVEVERRPRPIRVESIEILGLDLPRVVFKVACSAGTYVRVLCQSLGEKLDVGGCLEVLERTRVGPFRVGDSLTLEEVKKKVEDGELSGMLLPASRLAGHLPEMKLDGNSLALLCRGQGLKGPFPLAGLCRVVNPEGGLSVIGEISGDGRLNPKKVFGVEGID